MGNQPPIPSLAQKIADNSHYNQQNSTKDGNVSRNVRDTISTRWTACMKTEDTAYSDYDNGQEREKKIVQCCNHSLVALPAAYVGEDGKCNKNDARDNDKSA